MPPAGVKTPAGNSAMGTDGTTARVIAIFLLGCLAFGYPLLALFNVPAMVLGVPVLYFYVFGAWAALILLIAWAARRA